MKSVDEESGCAAALIQTHMFHHLTHGGEDAQAGVTVDRRSSARRVALIRIQIIIAIGRFRVPKAVAAVRKVEDAACMRLKVPFQMFLHLYI